MNSSVEFRRAVKKKRVMPANRLKVSQRLSNLLKKDGAFNAGFSLIRLFIARLAVSDVLQFLFGLVFYSYGSDKGFAHCVNDLFLLRSQ
jgi:hypothetical protein